MPVSVATLLQKPFVNFLLLIVVISTIFMASLGDRPFSAPSESRYVEIGREMAESGDYVTPRLNYVKYFEKPPLFYWIQALNTKYFGMDEFTARLPTALFSLLLCLATYFLSIILYQNRLSAWLATLVLATSIYGFALSRIVLVDVPVSLFLVATLTSFLYIIRYPDNKNRNLAIYLLYIFAAFAMLSKGLIGVAIPGAVIFLWLGLTHNWQLLKQMKLVKGTLLFLLIAAPWHIMVAARNPEFLHFYFIHEHFERYLTKEHGRYQPFWYFFAILLAGLFPWIGFAFQAAKTELNHFWKKRSENAIPLFLVIWIIFILGFFSLSDSKLPPYILPIFPPIAALIGHYLQTVWKNNKNYYFLTGVCITLLLLLALAVFPPLSEEILDPTSKIMTAVSGSKDDIRVLSIIAILAIFAVIVAWLQGEKRHIIIVLLVSAILITQAGDRIAGNYNKDSMKKLADAIHNLEKEKQEVILYGEYYQDLPIYLQRKVSLVGWEKTELAFGVKHEFNPNWFMDDAGFWNKWLKGNKPLFTIMRNDTYQILLKKHAGKDAEKDLHLYLITQDGRNLLFTNRLPEPKPAK